jgi:hypothetical protein
MKIINDLFDDDEDMTCYLKNYDMMKKFQQFECECEWKEWLKL